MSSEAFTIAISDMMVKTLENALVIPDFSEEDKRDIRLILSYLKHERENN